jgi:hypothetical protein
MADEKQVGTIKTTDKKNFFEQKINEQRPKTPPTKKTTWTGGTTTSKGVAMHGAHNRYERKTVTVFDEPPPPPKKISDLP